MTCSPAKVLQHSKKGKPLDTFNYRAYNKENILLLLLWKLVRNTSKGVALESVFPYDTFTNTIADTIRRWMKDLFTECKIFFSAHSCRISLKSHLPNFRVFCYYSFCTKIFFIMLSYSFCPTIVKGRQYLQMWVTQLTNIDSSCNKKKVNYLQPRPQGSFRLGHGPYI